MCGTCPRMPGYSNGASREACCPRIFDFYNRERYHQGLDCKTPHEIYCEKSPTVKRNLKKDKRYQYATLNSKNTAQQMGQS